jgi:hypothetical protein
MPRIRRGVYYCPPEGEDIIVTTVFSTSVPCYQIKSISAQEKEDKIEVKIKLEREEGACIECIGFQKITFRIKKILSFIRKLT